MPELPPPDLTRRRALTGMAGVGLVLPVLAACGGEEEATTGTDPAGRPSGGPATAGGAASDEPFVAASEIEVGGGAIFPDEEIVVTQPTDGEFKAFSAICTHQGCVVGEVTDEGIVCPCHFSVFSIEDGSPQDGPASAPLPEVAVRVEGGQVYLA